MALDWPLPNALIDYIETHLAYELKYLLVAATTWTAVHEEQDRGSYPDHLVVMAMESAFVHTRTLSEFLLKQEGWSKDRRTPHSRPKLPKWNHYSQPMHTKVLHPSPDRPYAPEVRKGDDLKDQVLDLASEVLAGWDTVAAQPGMGSYCVFR